MHAVVQFEARAGKLFHTIVFNAKMYRVSVVSQ